MKKLVLFAMTLVLVFGLTACQTKPFTPPVAGSEFITTDMIEYTYSNGIINEKLYTYTFSQEYYMFLGPIGISYDFKTINNYEEISADFIAFIDSFGDNVIYDYYPTTEYGDSLKLSEGSDGDSYNLVNVEIDGEVNDVDVFISAPNAVRIVFSYTEFYSDGKRIVVPYHITFLTHDMHSSYEWEYIEASNIYSPNQVVAVKYQTYPVPLPMKASVTSSYYSDKDTDIEDLGNYLRVYEDTSTITESIKAACIDEQTPEVDTCMVSEYSTVSAYIYDMTLSEAIVFYEENYGGLYVDNNFVIYNNGNTYSIIFAETTITTTDGVGADVISLLIEIVNN